MKDHLFDKDDPTNLIVNQTKYRSKCCNAGASVSGSFGGNGVTLLIRCIKCKKFLEVAELKDTRKV